MTRVSEGKRILVVDDSATCAHSIATLLRHVGHKVTIARNGHLACSLAAEQQFDLVLTDEQMPRMNGSELCRQLRALEGYKDVPFVLFTAKSRMTNVDLLRKELGIAGVIYKENSKSRIVAVVESALRNRLEGEPTNA